MALTSDESEWSKPRKNFKPLRPKTLIHDHRIWDASAAEGPSLCDEVGRLLDFGDATTESPSDSAMARRYEARNRSVSETPIDECDALTCPSVATNDTGDWEMT